MLMRRLLVVAVSACLLVACGSGERSVNARRDSGNISFGDFDDMVADTVWVGPPDSGVPVILPDPDKNAYYVRLADGATMEDLRAMDQQLGLPLATASMRWLGLRMSPDILRVGMHELPDDADPEEIVARLLSSDIVTRAEKIPKVYTCENQLQNSSGI